MEDLVEQAKTDKTLQALGRAAAEMCEYDKLTGIEAWLKEGRENGYLFYVEDKAYEKGKLDAMPDSMEKPVSKDC